METRLFYIHSDVKVMLEITQEKKDAILERILEYCMAENCIRGETLHQDDDCIINAPEVLSDIIDNILCFKSDYDQ